MSCGGAAPRTPEGRHSALTGGDGVGYSDDHSKHGVHLWHGGRGRSTLWRRAAELISLPGPPSQAAPKQAACSVASAPDPALLQPLCLTMWPTYCPYASSAVSWRMEVTR